MENECFDCCKWTTYNKNFFIKKPHVELLYAVSSSSVLVPKITVTLRQWAASAFSSTSVSPFDAFCTRPDLILGSINFPTHQKMQMVMFMALFRPSIPFPRPSLIRCIAYLLNYSVLYSPKNCVQWTALSTTRDKSGWSACLTVSH